MASEKISSLPSHTLNSADIIPVAEGGQNYGDTVGQIETAAAALVHWSALLGNLTETQVIMWDGPTPGTADTWISRSAIGTVAIGTTSTPGDASGTLDVAAINLSGLNALITISNPCSPSGSGQQVGIFLENPLAASAAVTTDGNFAPFLQFVYNYWDGSASSPDSWGIQASNSGAGGANLPSWLCLVHSQGGTGQNLVAVGTLGLFADTTPTGAYGTVTNYGYTLHRNGGTGYLDVLGNGTTNTPGLHVNGNGIFDGTSLTVDGNAALLAGLTSLPFSDVLITDVSTGVLAISHTNGQIDPGDGLTCDTLTLTRTGGVGTTAILNYNNGLQIFYGNSIGISGSGGACDVFISRATTNTLQIGTTASNSSGTLELKEIVLTDFGSTPTSSSGGGTAGTVGEIVQHSGLLYFCSVTGVAGSATWNVITMTQLP